MTSETLAFEEIQPGTSASARIEVTQDMVDAFAKLSRDMAPLHTDADFARKQGFPDRVAHGALCGAFFSQLIGMRLPGTYGILRSMELEFRAAVVPPQLLDFEVSVDSVSAAVREVALKLTCRSSDGKLCLKGKARSVLREPTA